MEDPERETESGGDISHLVTGKRSVKEVETSSREQFRKRKLFCSDLSELNVCKFCSKIRANTWLR